MPLSGLGCNSAVATTGNGSFQAGISMGRPSALALDEPLDRRATQEALMVWTPPASHQIWVSQ
jgi:hypothetical protein